MLHPLNQKVSTRLTAELCKAQLKIFVREFWSVIVEDPLVWSPHLDVLCDEIQRVYERVIARQPKEYDLIINIPPGTSKSTVCTIMAPAWSWARDQSLRHITGSYSADLSTEHATKSRDIIKSDKYRLYFPGVLIKPDEDNKTNYKTFRNGQRYSTSVGGTVTGVHGHIITIDDPLNPKQAASEADVKTANDWFDKTLPTRKVDKLLTPTILIMQRLATNDPTGHLLEKKKKGIRHICLPATLEPNVKPAELRAIYQSGYLDPLRLGREAVEEAKIDLGSDGYAGQFGQNPAPPGGTIWRKWFNEVPDHLFPTNSQLTDFGSDWDLAYTKDETNAATAYVSSGKMGEKVFITDFDWKWLEFPEMIKFIRSVQGPHYIEAKASGKSAKQVLSAQGVIAIEKKVEGGADKIARAKMATPIAESGIVYIKKSMADKLYNDSRQGILFFPKNPFKDLADALSQALLRHRKKGGVKIATTSTSSDDDVNPLDWI